MTGTVKLLAAAMVVLGGGYIGVFMASAFSVRIKQINQLKSIITQIGFNIGFLKMTVSDAMTEAAKTTKGAAANMFSYAATVMRENGEPPSAAMGKGILKLQNDLCLTKEDREIITEFARGLGTGDSQREESNIKAAIARLTLAEEEARAVWQRKGKLWQGLGFLGGILLAVILF